MNKDRLRLLGINHALLKQTCCPRCFSKEVQMVYSINADEFDLHCIECGTFSLQPSNNPNEALLNFHATELQGTH